MLTIASIEIRHIKRSCLYLILLLISKVGGREILSKFRAGVHKVISAVISVDELLLEVGISWREGHTPALASSVIQPKALVCAFPFVAGTLIVRARYFLLPG